MAKVFVIAVFLAVAAAVSPAGAGAATTFGGHAPFGPSSSAPAECAVVSDGVPVTCSLLNRFNVESSANPSGVAREDGVITGWEIGFQLPASVTSASVTPRVFRIQGGVLTAVSSGTSHALPPLTMVFSGIFPERLAIKKGEFFGFDVTSVGEAGAAPILMAPTDSSDAGYSVVTPALANGQSVTLPPSPSAGTRAQTYATLEPDVDGDAFGDETQDRCPQRADVQTTCPAPRLTELKSTTSSIKFKSDLAGTATVTISKTHSGHKADGKCSIHKHHGKRCSTYKRLAKWSARTPAGTNKLKYAKRVHGGSLAPGR